MKRDATRLMSAAGIFLALLAAVDVSVGVVADRLATRLPDFGGGMAKDNYRLHRLDAEIVVIGSSRGEYHYVTSQLEDSAESLLGRRPHIYNAAISGKFVKSNSCCAEELIARYNPRIVILELTEGRLCDPGYGDIEFSSPYYWHDTIVRRYLDDISARERLLMKSSLYRYNNKVVQLLYHLRPAPEDDGYIPLYGCSLDTTFTQTAEAPQPLDPYTVRHFEEVLRRYADSDATLIVACSPRFRPVDNQRRLADLCGRYGIPFVDMYDMPQFNLHPEYFKDASHLNDKGAHVFTALFFSRLKPFLQQ